MGGTVGRMARVESSSPPASSSGTLRLSERASFISPRKQEGAAPGLLPDTYTRWGQRRWGISARTGVEPRSGQPRPTKPRRANFPPIPSPYALAKPCHMRVEERRARR